MLTQGCVHSLGALGCETEELRWRLLGWGQGCQRSTVKNSSMQKYLPRFEMDFCTLVLKRKGKTC